MAFLNNYASPKCDIFDNSEEGQRQRREGFGPELPATHGAFRNFRPPTGAAALVAAGLCALGDWAATSAAPPAFQTFRIFRPSHNCAKKVQDVHFGRDGLVPSAIAKVLQLPRKL